MKKKITIEGGSQSGEIWSGRGIGVPVGGAIGGGDDYKQKIGRNKIPWTRTGFKGSPSQSADSGYSSFLARVNKGYEDIEYDEAMFPEQEPYEEDIYDSGVDGIRSRKVPQTFKVKRPKMKGIREISIFDEDYVVKNSQYSLLDIPREYTVEEILEEGMLGQLFTDITGDFAAAALGAGTLGLSSAGFVIWNIMQLKDDMRNADVAIEAFRRNPNDDTAKEMSDVLDSMAINLIDLFQRFLEVSPDPVGEGASFLTSIMANINRFRRFLASKLTWTGLSSAPGSGNASKLWGKLKVVGLVTPILKFIMKVLDSDDPPDSFTENKTTLLGVPKRMILLSDLIEDYEIQKDGAAAAGVEFVYRPRMDIPSDLSSYDTETFLRDERSTHAQQMLDRATSQTMHQWDASGRPIMTNQQTSDMSPDLQPFTDPGAAYRYVQSMTPGRDLFLEENTMSKELKELRAFIRETAKSIMNETVYEDVPSLHPPKPNAYMFRDVPTVVSEDEEEGFEVEDNYDGFSVAYKTDGGVINYQSRSMIKEEREEALRRIIRRRIRSTMTESKKKVDEKVESDHPEMTCEEAHPDMTHNDFVEKKTNEYSGAGAVAGVQLPLGDSPPTFGRKRRSPAEAAGSAYGNAKPVKDWLY